MSKVNSKSLCTLNGLSASVARFKSELSGNKKLEKELK
jgi:hypothetical protein